MTDRTADLAMDLQDRWRQTCAEWAEASPAGTTVEEMLSAQFAVLSTNTLAFNAIRTWQSCAACRENIDAFRVSHDLSLFATLGDMRALASLEKKPAALVSQLMRQCRESLDPSS